MGVLSVFGAFAVLNSKVSFVLNEANSEDIPVLYASDSTDTMASDINPGPASTIIA